MMRMPLSKPQHGDSPAHVILPTLRFQGFEEKIQIFCCHAGPHILHKKQKNLTIYFPINISIFSDIVQCSSYVNRRFGGTHHFHLQGGKISRVRNQLEAGG
jgi:hypothetical protein